MLELEAKNGSRQEFIQQLILIKVKKAEIISPIEIKETFLSNIYFGKESG